MIFPLFPLVNFRRTRRRLKEILKSKHKIKQIANDKYFEELIELILTIKYEKLKEYSYIQISNHKYGYYIRFSLYSDHSISIEKEYNFTCNEIYFSVGGTPFMEGDVICEYERPDKELTYVKKWFEGDIVHEKYCNNNRILKSVYTNKNTGYVLSKSIEIRYYWKKITNKEVKEYESWVKPQTFGVNPQA